MGSVGSDLWPALYLALPCCVDSTAHTLVSLRPDASLTEHPSALLSFATRGAGPELGSSTFIFNLQCDKSAVSHISCRILSVVLNDVLCVNAHSLPGEGLASAVHSVSIAPRPGP
jgi:hypothetical protein